MKPHKEQNEKESKEKVNFTLKDESPNCIYAISNTGRILGRVSIDSQSFRHYFKKIVYEKLEQGLRAPKPAN